MREERRKAAREVVSQGLEKLCTCIIVLWKRKEDVRACAVNRT